MVFENRATCIPPLNRLLEPCSALPCSSSPQIQAHAKQTVERIVAYCAFDTTHLDELNEDRRRAVRRNTFRLLSALPALHGDQAQWMRSAAAVLQSAAEAVAVPVQHTGARTLPTGSAMQGRETSTVFAAHRPSLSAQTIHSIKGEDREAVMVVVRRSHGGDPSLQLELWEAAADGSKVEEDKQEERRVLFVALTRAPKILSDYLPRRQARSPDR